MRCDFSRGCWGLSGFRGLLLPMWLFFICLSKCLAHQASHAASHTAFVGLKRQQFYLSHLPAYFSEVNKRAMLASPLVCADTLFAELDIARLLSNTQTSSSLRSQLALVDVASRGSGARRRRFSPVRSPSCSSRRRRRDSGSPGRRSKRVSLTLWLLPL